MLWKVFKALETVSVCGVNAVVWRPPGHGGGLGEGEDAQEVWSLVVLEEEQRQTGRPRLTP